MGSVNSWLVSNVEGLIHSFIHSLREEDEKALGDTSFPNSLPSAILSQLLSDTWAGGNWGP